MSCQLYLITPPALPDLDAFAEVFAAALDAGPVACVQLRLKDATDDAIRAAANRLRPIAQDRDVAFLLNDRPDLAAELGCDGVHIGQEDGTYAEARRIVGPDAIVGVTCHDSRHLAMAAGEAGADYVAFGAFFPTTTKEPETTAEIELLEWWAELFTVPCVAIGGITVDNAKALVDAGADFVAVCGGVWSHPEGPAAAVKAFGTLCASSRDA
jgi:thiamine-phosphate pyrophosphorylase